MPFFYLSNALGLRRETNPYKMDEKNTADVKQPEGTGEEKSAPEETTPTVSEDVKTPEEQTPAQKAEALLDNKRVVDAKRFNEINDKAKMYDTHALLLDKVLKNPDLVEELLETKKKGALEEQVAQLVEERKVEKRNEIRTALTSALSKWPNLANEWAEIQPMVDMLYKQKGLPYEEAIRRSYIAEHPEVAQEESQRIASEALNRRGALSGGGSNPPEVAKVKTGRELNTGEQRVARAYGKSDEEYAGLLQKHDSWLRQAGFYEPSLEKEL